jgi:predicted ATPase
MATLTPAIVGRDAELQTVERFLDELGSAVTALAIEGEAGIGKTTVWREGVAGAERRSYRVLRAQPAESESTLSYAALADLIGSAFDEARSELPAPQQRGLEVALLRTDPDGATDPRTIAGLGVEELREAATRVRAAAAQMEREDSEMRYVRSTIVPMDEAFLSLFEATSEGLVREAYARAEVTFERISNAVSADV